MVSCGPERKRKGLVGTNLCVPHPQNPPRSLHPPQPSFSGPCKFPPSAQRGASRIPHPQCPFRGEAGTVAAVRTPIWGKERMKQKLLVSSRDEIPLAGDLVKTPALVMAGGDISCVSPDCSPEELPALWEVLPQISSSLVSSEVGVRCILPGC